MMRISTSWSIQYLPTTIFSQSKVEVVEEVLEVMPSGSGIQVSTFWT